MKKLLSAGAVLFAAASLIRPYDSTEAAVSRGPVLGSAEIDEGTRALLRRACFDCHSSETRWPWYSRIAPMSWAIAKDVHDARARMNLSDWRIYSQDRRLELLGGIANAARLGRMPPSRYELLHPEARLTAAERQQIDRWSRVERARLRAAK